MIRIYCRRVVAQMAGDAFLRRPPVHSVLVAAGAGDRRVAPGQRILRAGCMIETPVAPGRRSMAHRTILRESGETVVRVLCSVIGAQMAGDTVL